MPDREKPEDFDAIMQLATQQDHEAAALEQMASGNMHTTSLEMAIYDMVKRRRDTLAGYRKKSLAEK